MRAPSLPTIQGVTDFRSLLEFVRHGEEYDAALTALEAHQAECRRLIGLVADANDLDRQRAQATADRTMAAEELRNAKAEAAALRATLAQEQAAVAARLRQSDAEIAQARREWEAQARAQRTDLEARESAVAAHATEAQALHTDAVRIHAEGQALKAEYERKLAVIKQKQAELANA